jgi:hypothetical protein
MQDTENKMKGNPTTVIITTTLIMPA